ncbi:Serine/threonine protein kinase [Microbotryomycetes sp. JL221]|nr:Serine/threonine protein kinase [Microbotryomycetes sp. JL221]
MSSQVAPATHHQPQQHYANASSSSSSSVALDSSSWQPDASSSATSASSIHHNHHGTGHATGLTGPHPSSSSSVPSTSASVSSYHVSNGGFRSAPYSRVFPPPLEPRSYTILKEVGDGSFGTVWLADWHSQLELPPGTLPPGPSSRPEFKGKNLVAVKRMKKSFDGGWDECLKLKELKSLQQIPMHPNIIPLYDAFLMPSTRELYFVFECMEGNLYQLTKSRKGRYLAAGLVASIFQQILAGLDHIHRSGFFHRDMKPENLLITTTGLADYPASSLYALPSAPSEKDVVVIVKLADFGLARETNSRPPYTEYVSTRWYRAPEVLLRSREYSNPVDMWALGTILVEILTLKPLFPGDSEVDQVFKICEVLGDPSTEYGYDDRGRLRGGGVWPRGIKLAKDVGFAFPKIPPRTFVSLFDTNLVSMQMIDCIADLLRFEPKARLTTQQCLDHAYFREVAYRYAPYRPPTSTAPSLSNGIAPRVNGTTASSSQSEQSARQLPPSHSLNSARPAFHAGDGAQRLPSVNSQGYYSSGSTNGHVVPRHPSDASHVSVSGMSAYQMQVNPPAEDTTMAFPESVDAASPSTTSVWSGPRAEPSWSSVPADYTGTTRPIPAFGGQHQRRPSFSGSIAPSIGGASTFYDGSIFEGYTTGRAESIMSVPVNYDSMEHSPPLGGTPSIAPTGAPPDRTQPQAQAPAQASSASIKSGRWGFGKAFGSSSSAQNVDQQSVKRAPSIAAPSLYAASEHGTSSSVPLDPKAAKQAKKEAEKLKREMQQQAARERARAVMRKKQQLMEASDPLHTMSAGGGMGLRTMPADKGKARAADQRMMAATNAKMPQIVEDTSRLHVSGLHHKARRRDVDDDVHSVSSNDTGFSAHQHRGRPLSVSGFSISSVATSASDPERRSQHQYDPGVVRAPSHSSILSTASRPHPHAGFRHAPPPSTGHSSIDSQLLVNMQSLATSGEPGWRSPTHERSDSRGTRGTSPHLEPRYSPYPSFQNGAAANSTTSAATGGRSPNPHQLPPISTFDPTQYRAFDAIKSSAASIASFHSTPGILPSYGAGATRHTMDVDVPHVSAAARSALDAALPNGQSPSFPYKTSDA